MSIVETDSRTHVEKLQVNIARAMDAAGLGPADIGCIVVGVGPAPFTGLRAGLVTASARLRHGGPADRSEHPRPAGRHVARRLRGDAVIADAAGFLADVSHTAQNGQADGRPEPERHITLCVNDARRKQLYFSLNHEAGVTAQRRIPAIGSLWTSTTPAISWSGSTRGTPSRGDWRHAIHRGRGRSRGGPIRRRMAKLDALGSVVEGSILDAGAAGLAMFAEMALKHADDEAPVEPLYLRRPDAEVPSPLKHVLNHAGAQRAD